MVLKKGNLGGVCIYSRDAGCPGSVAQSVRSTIDQVYMGYQSRTFMSEIDTDKLRW